MVDKHTVVVQEHLKQNKAINANTNLKNATDAIVSALAGFNLVGERVEGELVAA